MGINPTPETLIADVSDTALWVAYYRYTETQRPDALFHDPLAKKLVGEKGQKIAKNMGRERYVSWSLAIRTHIIDTYIQELIAQKKINTVLNLGAGLDTRPYRLSLPSDFQWIEVDYPHMISYKEKHLKQEIPICHLERIPLDLTQQQARIDLFSKVANSSNSILVLTEGVIPYLTNEQCGSLATELHAHKQFRFWIIDYFSNLALLIMRSGRVKQQLKNAPFQFNPKDWFGFFQHYGWKAKSIRYLGQESKKLDRPVPLPYLAKLLCYLTPLQYRSLFYNHKAYALLEPVQQS